MEHLEKGDKRFLTAIAMPSFGIRKVRVKYSDSKKKWPDIWCNQNGGIPTITVTAEWSRQTPDERRKRLVHELIHLAWKMGHSDKIGYSTLPDKDTYSMKVYQQLMRRVGSAQQKP